MLAGSLEWVTPPHSPRPPPPWGVLPAHTPRQHSAPQVPGTSHWAGDALTPLAASAEAGKCRLVPDSQQAEIPSGIPPTRRAAGRPMGYCPELGDCRVQGDPGDRQGQAQGRGTGPEPGHLPGTWGWQCRGLTAGGASHSRQTRRHRQTASSYTPQTTQTSSSPRGYTSPTSPSDSGTLTCGKCLG